jgi:hypothetical protein
MKKINYSSILIASVCSLNSCEVITVPVKVAGKVVTTTVGVAGKVAETGIDVVTPRKPNPEDFEE